MCEYIIFILSHPLSHTSSFLKLFGFPKLPTMHLTGTLIWNMTVPHSSSNVYVLISLSQRFSFENVTINNDSIESDTENTNNKINNQEMGLHGTQSFCTARETLRMKRLSTEGENMFRSQILDKGLVSKHIKGL